MTYLTEKKLGEILTQLYNTVVPQFNLRKLGFDRAYKIDYFVPKYNLFFEFNGYHHYNAYKVIKRDIEVAKFLIHMQYTLITIPYFVQFDVEFLNYLVNRTKQLININTDNKTDILIKFPHGFIDKKALRPRDFNIYGLIRFWYELSCLPKSIRQKIIKTLEEPDIYVLKYLKNKVFDLDIKFDIVYM